MMDQWRVEKCLHLTCYFTCYVQCLVTSSLTTRCTAQTLWDRFIVHYGLPERIVIHQGWDFKSDLIGELCKLAKAWKLCTRPFHPQAKKQCKIFNHTLKNMLGTLLSKKRSSWRYMVQPLVHAYNYTRSTAMGFSCYFLIYGQKP